MFNALKELGIRVDTLREDKGNSIRQRILSLIIDKKEISISEIHKRLVDGRTKKNYNYRTIWQHVERLKKDGEVSIEKQEQQRGKPIIVRPSTLTQKILSFQNKHNKELAELVKASKEK